MLFTGHGDAGYTSTIGGPPLPKCDVRMEAIGALDEAQAHLGLIRALLADNPLCCNLKRVQADLQLVMSECATVACGGTCGQYLTPGHIANLEADMAGWEGRTAGFTKFAIPGDTVLDAHLHLARTAIRRAERQVVALHQSGGMDNPIVLGYLNRLSSWVFALTMLTDSASNGGTQVAA